MLEKKEKVLLKKMATEVEKAKEFTKAKNKRGRNFYLLLDIFFMTGKTDNALLMNMDFLP